MSLQMPVLVDPWRLVDLRKRFFGAVPLTAFPRLVALLGDPAGEITFELRFERDEQGRPVVRGGCRGTLRLRCQRCLGEMEYPVDAEIGLGVVSGLGEAERLPRHLDPLLVLEPEIKPLEILEDELLLALPDVPMHDPKACRGSTWGSGKTESDAPGDEQASPGPFSVLAKLKRD